MSISRGMKEGARGREGRIGDRRERQWRGRDTIHGSLARQASQPATVALGGFPLRHYPLPSPPSRRSSTPLCRARILCPANLPPFTRFHSYERRRKGALVVCETRTKARRRACPCMRAFFSLLGNVGMGVGRGVVRTRKEREAAATASRRARGRTRSRFQYASEENLENLLWIRWKCAASPVPFRQNAPHGGDRR